MDSCSASLGFEGVAFRDRAMARLPATRESSMTKSLMRSRAASRVRCDRVVSLSVGGEGGDEALVEAGEEADDEDRQAASARWPWSMAPRRPVL